MQRRDYLIITNSSIGMESARTYTSVSAKSYQTSGSLIAFPGILADAYGAKEKQEVSKEEAGEEGSGKADAQNTKNDFDSIFNRIRHKIACALLQAILKTG